MVARASDLEMRLDDLTVTHKASNNTENAPELHFPYHANSSSGLDPLTEDDDASVRMLASD